MFRCPACKSELEHEVIDENGVKQDIYVCHTDGCPIYAIQKFVHATDDEFARALTGEKVIAGEG